MTAFKCLEIGCGKSFTRKDYLKRHIANHTTVKPYACVQCQVLFTRKDILEKHYKTKAHHNKRNQLTKFILKEETPNKMAKGPKKRPRYNDTASGVEKSGMVKRQQMNDPNLKKKDVIHEDNGAGIHMIQKNNGEAEIHMSQKDNIEPGIHMFQKNKVGMSKMTEEYTSSPLDTSIDWLFGDIEGEGRNTLFLANIIDSTPPMKDTDYIVPSRELEQLTLHRVSSKLDQLNVRCYKIEQFSHYLDNFWTYFATIYPIIHQPTFDPNSANTWLLISMLSVGMCFASYNEHNKQVRDCAISINTVLRFHIFQEAGDSPTLSHIQALLLDNFCCKLLGSPREINMSQIFHGTAINFLRHLGYFEKKTKPFIAEFKDLDVSEKEAVWRDWIQFETCKRTAFFGFILDCQNASLFRDLQLLSIFEIHLELPCSDSLWTSTGAENFFIEFERQPKELKVSLEPSWLSTEDADILLKITLNEDKKNRYSKPSMMQIELEGDWPDFLWSLRRLMQPYEKFQKEYNTNCFSQFSRLILLHGILSITWDLKSRSLLDLGFLSKKSLVLLLSRLNLALLNWRGYFEKQIKLTNRARFGMGLDMLNDYGVSNLFWNTISLFQFARITLNADLVALNDLKTEFIKSKGQLLQLNDQYSLRKKHAVQSWARTIDSKKAVNAACKILNNFTSNMNSVRELPYMSKILYFAGIVIWAHETNTEILGSSNIPELSKISKEKYIADGSLDLQLVKSDLIAYVMSVLEGKPKEKDLETYRETQQQVIAVLLFTSTLIQDFNCEEKSGLTQILEYY